MSDNVRVHSPKNLKQFDRGSLSMSSESTCYGFNMILLSSPQHVPRPSYPFRRNFERSGKGSLDEKAELVN